jgi:hypothetical protein
MTAACPAQALYMTLAFNRSVTMAYAVLVGTSRVRYVCKAVCNGREMTTDDLCQQYTITRNDAERANGPSVKPY